MVNSRTTNLNLELITDPNTTFEHWRLALNGEGNGTTLPFSNAQKIDQFAGQINTALSGIYTKSEIDTIIESLARIDIVIVHSLDDVTEPGHIYLIPIEDLNSSETISEEAEESPVEEAESSSDNVYIEYIYIEGHGPERIGSTDIDLSQVYTKDEINGLLDTKQNVIDEDHKLDYGLLTNIPSVPLNDVFVVDSFDTLQSEGYVEAHLTEILQSYKIHVLSQKSTFYRQGEPTPQAGHILLDAGIGARLSSHYLYITEGETSRTFLTINSETYEVNIEIKEQLGNTKLELANQTISTWSEYDNDTYSYVGYVYNPEITENTILEVFFSLEQAISQDYAPVCETSNGKVAIYSKVDDEITIPLIKEL